MQGAGPALVQPLIRRLRRTPRQALVLGLGLGLAATLASCGGGPISSADTSVGCSVTVLIPSSGSNLLGSVTATSGGRTYQFHRNINTIAVGCGSRATLTAIAADPTAHPFTHWTVRGAESPTSTVSLTVDGLVSAQPGFLVPKASPTPSAPARPKVTPTPSATPATVTLDQWVSYDSATKTVTWRVVAGSPAVNLGLNFDGYDKGAMTLTVPSGWSVTVNFSNQGSINHSAAVVTTTGTTPVFAGAETPIPMAGTAPGQTASFTFTASSVGAYRLSCLIPGHESAGMWVTFKVTSGGLPNVHL